MSRSKPKFEDVVLPGFEQPEPEPDDRGAPRTMAQKETDAKISYRRYRPTKRNHCDICFAEHRDGSGGGISQASYIRFEGAEQVYLCFFHKAEAEHRDKLNANHGES